MLKDFKILDGVNKAQLERQLSIYYSQGYTLEHCQVCYSSPPAKYFFVLSKTQEEVCCCSVTDCPNCTSCSAEET